MKVLGIDLSGPGNNADTCLVTFQPQGDELHFLDARHGADDHQILETILGFREDESIVVGIDAPLSYQPGGGDRPSDKALRGKLKEKGCPAHVMTPTMTHMVYLTLHGIGLARMLESLRPEHELKIVEVHPGASMCLRDAPGLVLAIYKHNGEVSACRRLLDWLSRQGLAGLPKNDRITNHFVDACAAALGAWGWTVGKSAWIHPAEPPHHPYDFAC